MSLDDLANASYEKKQQRIMIVRKWFNEQTCVTVASVMAKTGYAESTVRGWAKEGNIPLFIDNNTTIVPMTEENKPKWWKWSAPCGSNKKDSHKKNNKFNKNKNKYNNKFNKNKNKANYRKK